MAKAKKLQKTKINHTAEERMMFRKNWVEFMPELIGVLTKDFDEELYDLDSSYKENITTILYNKSWCAKYFNIASAVHQCEPINTYERADELMTDILYNSFIQWHENPDLELGFDFDTITNNIHPSTICYLNGAMMRYFLRDWCEWSEKRVNNYFNR